MTPSSAVPPAPAAETGNAGPNRQVPALVRAKRVLDEISLAGRPKGISELARALDLPKSSVHGLCTTMADLGLLTRLDGNQFAIGPHILLWASAFQNQSDLTREFQRVLDETGLLREEALNLTILSGHDVVYVACRNGTRPLGLNFRVGMSLPAVFTATGKAICSTLSPGTVDRLFGGSWPAPPTRSSVPSLLAFHGELEETRRRGYSIDDGQLRDGMLCFGAPVFAAGQTAAVAGIAVGFLAAEADEAARRRIGGALIDLAGALSHRLGAKPG